MAKEKKFNITELSDSNKIYKTMIETLLKHSDKCKHQYRIFKDIDAIKSGYITFYCQYCLELRKIEKKYIEVDNIVKQK